MKTVLVNFVICRNSLGENGWQNDPAMIADFEQLIDEVNLKYANAGTVEWPMTCPPTINYVPDSKVRFKLNNVYFFNNDAYNAYSSLAAPTALLNDLWTTYPESRGALNHIWTQPNTWGGGWWGFYSTYQGESFVLTRNAMWGTSSVYTKHHVSHEYGHAVGLHHTYDGEVMNTQHYDFLDDLFGTCPEPLMMDPGNPCYPDAGSPCSPAPDHVCYLKANCFFANFPDAMPPLMSGMEDNQYISHKCSGRMHRALSLFNNSFVLNNKPMHKYVEEQYSYAIPYTVSTNESWDFAIKMYQDIVVEAPAVLTLKCEVRMPISGRIIVKPGAKLVIDGGVITCAHDGHFWQGIEAWGTTNQHQYPATQPTYQGMVVLKNDALIEHARVGFTNWRPNVKASRGGVLQVQGTLNGTGGTFRNCKRGVEFKQYRNFLQGYPTITRNNISYFRHADFIVNDDYRGGDDFDTHVDLWDVTGISFTQCDFINAQASGVAGINESHKLGQGISSLDATFSVTGQCAISLPLCEYGSGAPEPVCPEQHRRPSRFIGLDHGIEASNSGTVSRTFTVRDSHFENNICGVFSEGVDNAAMLRNTFVVGGREVANLTGLDVNFDGMHRAVYTHHANAFRVEENDLYPATTPLVQVEGVVVGSTNAYNDQVYKNFSHGMDFGFVAENDCVDGGNPVNTGLSLLCNQNNQNQEEDFKVRTTWPTIPPPLNHSIKVFQGSTSKSAGNTFTPTQNGSSPHYNYNNDPEQLPITYFWETPPRDLNTGAFNTPWVQRHTVISPANTCPTRITCPGSTPQMKAALDPQMEQEQLAYLNLKYVYESLLDGGDFEGLKETIMESWPQDAWELRNELMSKSPYLSAEILKEAGLKNILPHAMYLEVCVANPEATQRDGFVKWVQYEMPNPLPEYMVAQIVASWDQRTWRTSLESAMGWHVGEYQRLNDQVIGAMLNDTIPQPADSVLVRWQLNPSLRARYGEVGVLLEKNDFAAAEALLNGLDQTYRLQEADKQERDDMLALIAVVRTAQAADRTIMQLDSAEVQTLEAIAARQPSRAATHARGILCFGYGICTPPVTGETPQPKSQWTGVSVQDIKENKVLVVHPNPANNWVAFSHDLTGLVDRAYIRVRDMQGREVYTTAIASSPGQHIWDARGMAAGTYTVELHNKGRFVETQRVVIRP